MDYLNRQRRYSSSARESSTMSLGPAHFGRAQIYAQGYAETLPSHPQSMQSSTTLAGSYQSPYAESAASSWYPDGYKKQSRSSHGSFSRLPPPAVYDASRHRKDTTADPRVSGPPPSLTNRRGRSMSVSSYGPADKKGSIMSDAEWAAVNPAAGLRILKRSDTMGKRSSRRGSAVSSTFESWNDEARNQMREQKRLAELGMLLTRDGSKSTHDGYAHLKSSASHQPSLNGASTHLPSSRRASVHVMPGYGSATSSWTPSTPYTDPYTPSSTMPSTYLHSGISSQYGQTTPSMYGSTNMATDCGKNFNTRFQPDVRMPTGHPALRRRGGRDSLASSYSGPDSLQARDQQTSAVVDVKMPGGTHVRIVERAKSKARRAGRRMSGSVREWWH